MVLNSSDDNLTCKSIDTVAVVVHLYKALYQISSINSRAQNTHCAAAAHTVLDLVQNCQQQIYIQIYIDVFRCKKTYDASDTLCANSIELKYIKRIALVLWQISLFYCRHKHCIVMVSTGLRHAKCQKFTQTTFLKAKFYPKNA